MSSSWSFPWKSGNAIPPAASPRRRPDKSLGKTHDNLGKSLLLSLLLHALVISMQFGEYADGLPWFGMPGEARMASIPTLNAILRNQASAEVPTPNEFTDHTFGRNTISSGPPPPRKPLPPKLAVTHEPTIASIGETKVALQAQEGGEKKRVAEMATEIRHTDASEGGIAVLSTETESTWSEHVAKATMEEEKTRNDLPIKQKAAEAQAIEQKMIEDQAQIQAEKAEKAQQAAIAKAKEDALARQKAEEQAQVEAEKAKQAAVAREEALMRQQTEEQARIEAEKAKQAAEVRAREEIMAKRAEEEALAHRRQMDAARLAEKAAAERIQAAEQSSRNFPSATAGKPEGAREDGSGQTTNKGRELAGRAAEMVRNGLAGYPAMAAVEALRPRRGSILGRDPKDIQLAFYGEGWRQKVERIGSMNYPRLSRNLVYESLVVTVSINSDGTLAGLRIEKSSGHRELDEAVRRIVEMSAPFSAFPPDLKRIYDVVDITRTWTFQEERPRITSQ